jgi:Na+-driven multidrug efflux pump
MLFCQNEEKINDLELFLSFGSSTLKVHCITLPLMAINGTSSMLLQTTGKSIRASILAIARQGLFFVPLLFILGRSVQGIKYVQVFADTLTLIVTIIILISMLKELNKLKRTI